MTASGRQGTVCSWAGGGVNQTLLPRGSQKSSPPDAGSRFAMSVRNTRACWAVKRAHCTHSNEMLAVEAAAKLTAILGYCKML